MENRGGPYRWRADGFIQQIDLERVRSLLLREVQGSAGVTMTKEQAQKTHVGDELHCGRCKRIVGPRGGVKEKIERWRVSGRCKVYKSVWRANAAYFRLPIKYGLYRSSAVEPHNQDDFHLASECPLLQHFHLAACSQGDSRPQKYEGPADACPICKDRFDR